MIAEIIPYRRTIRGKEYFDYHIPPDMTVSRGDIVLIPFRSSTIPGLVWNMKEKSSVKSMRDIVSVNPLPFWRDENRLRLLEWFASYYFVSLPTAWKVFQYPLLKRPRAQKEETLLYSLVKTADAMPFTIPQSAVHRIQSAVRELETTSEPHQGTQREYLLHYTQRADCFASYRGIVRSASSNVLFIVPEHTTVEAVAALFEKKRLIVVSSETSPSEWHAIEQLLSHSSDIIIIGTKKAAFLSPHHFSHIILDEEEARSHVQFDQNPRFDVRAILHMSAVLYAHNGPIVIYSSRAPRIDSYYDAGLGTLRILDIRRAWTHDHIEVVSMEEEKIKKNYTWFSEHLINAVHRSRKTLLFFNRTGTYGVAICQDCSLLLPLHTVSCSHCHSTRIRYAQKGTQQLEKELHALFPGKRILRIDRDQENVHMSIHHIDNADIIVGTEKIFRLLPLEHFDLIGILSVDHALLYPHYQANERVYQLLTHLFSAGVHTILQTHAPEHAVIRSSVRNDWDAFAKEELELREMLQLPPYGQRFRLIHSETKKQMGIEEQIDSATLGVNTIVERL
jgi:primosomal protein N'